MTRGIKSLILEGAGRFFRFSGLSRPDGRKLYIATFHRVLPEELLKEYPMKGLAVTVCEFDWFVRFFQKWFVPVSMKEVGELYFSRKGKARRRSKPLLAITFDDGQLDNYLNAYPTLKKYGLKASFFIPVEGVNDQSLLWHDRMAYALVALASEGEGGELLGELSLDRESARKIPAAGVRKAKEWTQEKRIDWIKRAEKITGGKRPDWDGMMSWEQIREMSASGQDIGSHTLTHPILVQCDDSSLEREIRDSGRILSERTGSPVVSFCYPNGDNDDRVVEQVSRAGYSTAVTTKWGSNDINSDLWSLCRLDMTSEHSKDGRNRLSENRVMMRMSGFKRGS